MIRTIIVDDEQPALTRLEKLLKESGLAAVEGCFTDGMEAISYIIGHPIEAVLLDIEMPEINGIDLANRIIEIRHDVAIIFVTAYNQYAVEAFQLNALDYLLKPVSLLRLKETLERTEHWKRGKDCGKGLRVQCFGKFHVSVDHEPVKFRTEKAEELLAFLVDCKGRFVSRSKIIDSLWENFEGDRALIHFNTTLHYVKKALLFYDINVTIIYDKGNYMLEQSEIDCDYIEFSGFISNIVEINQENCHLFEKTADLYQGSYLSGWDYDWVIGKRLTLEEEYLGLVSRLAEYYKQEKDFHKVSKWTKVGLLQEPLHRDLNYRLIEAQIASDEPVLAQKYYENYKSMLHKKLGIEPDQDMKRLVHNNLN